MSDPRVRGVIHFIDQTKTYGQKGFRKRLVVLEQENDRFTNYVPVEFIQDGCDTVDQLKVGDQVEITYRLSGRKWQKDPSSEVKYFLNAEAIRFEVVSEGNKASAAQTSAAKTPDANAGFAEAAYDEDDVPF